MLCRPGLPHWMSLNVVITFLAHGAVLEVNHQRHANSICFYAVVCLHCARA